MQENPSIASISATQLARGLLLKMLKYFKIMLNIFEVSDVKLVHINKFSSIIQSCYLAEKIKRSYCQLLFLTFYNFYERKINFGLKIVIVITVTISSL